MRTKNLASEEKSPGYATPKSRLVPGKQKINTYQNGSGKDGVSDPDPTTLLNPDRYHNFTSFYQVSF
jgi:hypothetical protein